MFTSEKRIFSQKGQGLTELALALPLLFLLALGAIEISNIVNAYLTLSHITREGANMISLGKEPDAALSAIVKSACPLIGNGITCPVNNTGSWRVIYSRVGPANDPVDPNKCGPDDSRYVVLEQIMLGGLNKVSKINPAVCGDADLPNVAEIGTGRNFYVVEVFYSYQTITPVGNFGVSLNNPAIFYERAIF